MSLDNEPENDQEYLDKLAEVNQEIQGWVGRIGADLPAVLLKPLGDLDVLVMNWTTVHGG